MSALKLTEGMLEQMFLGENLNRPKVQVTGIKRIDTPGTAPRYRLTLNDGKYTTSSVLLSTQKNDAIDGGELSTFCIIEVLEFLPNTIQNRRLVMISDFVVVTRGDDVQREIGTPRPLDIQALFETTNNSTPGGGRTAATADTGSGQQQPPPSSNGQQQQWQGVAGSPVRRDPAPATGQRTVAVAHQKNGAGANPPPNIFPLNSITPYQNKWCVRARVTKKYAIRTYHNSRGEGKLFSVDLADESGEMRATGFNQECDKYYDFLKEGAVYYIRGGQIKSANRQYTSINNDYELTFGNDTQIEPCFDDNVYQLPSVTFNFVKLDKLALAPRDRVIDVVGVVDSIGSVQSLTSRKTNQELKKRDVRLVDDTLTSISLTLWGAEAENFEHDGHPVMAIKGVRIGEFNGINLATTASSQLHLNPDVPESHRLRGWYDSKGHEAQMKNLSSGGGPGSGAGGGFIPIALAEADRLGTGDKPDYYSVKGFISYVRRENCLYKACPSEECNKKVVDQGTGRYRCERCNKEQDNFKWRLMLQVTINDLSGTQPVTLFNDQAEQMLGIQSQDLADLRDRNEEEFNQALDKPLFKQYSFRLRAKMDLYNDEMRMKVMCQRVENLNVSEYTKFLTEEIKKLEALPELA